MDNTREGENSIEKRRSKIISSHSKEIRVNERRLNIIEWVLIVVVILLIINIGITVMLLITTYDPVPEVMMDVDVEMRLSDHDEERFYLVVEVVNLDKKTYDCKIDLTFVNSRGGEIFKQERFALVKRGTKEFSFPVSSLGGIDGVSVKCELFVDDHRIQMVRQNIDLNP